MSKYSYIGKGKIYLEKLGSTNPRKFIGNASVLALAVEEDEKSLLNFTEEGGGKDDSLRRITAVTANMTLHNLSPENLALALFGSAADVASGAVTDEVHNDVQKGGLVRFAKIPDPAQTITVEPAGGGTAFVLNTDYERTPSGIVILESGSIANGADIQVDYTAQASSLIQTLVNTSDEYALTFEGLNEAKSGRPVIVDLFRVKFGATQGLDLISDDFAGLEIEGEVLASDSIVGAGLSKFAKIEMVKAA